MRFDKVLNWFKTRKKVVLAVLAAAILILGVWKVFGKKTPSTQYQTARVEKGTIILSVSASGKVLTNGVINITTNASGVVNKVYVKEGDQVRSGQKIAEITLDQAGQQQNASAWSNYLAAKNSLASAQSTLYTLQNSLFVANQKFINDAVARGLETDDPTYIEENANWLAAEAQYKNQELVINQAKSAMNSAWLSYSNSSPVIISPVSGIVSSVNLVEGMTISANQQISSNSTLSSSQIVVSIKKQNASNPLLNFSLSETDISKIETGQKATISLDSLPDKTFTGRVVSVDRIGSVSNNVTSYSVNILLDTQSPEILPNMAANAKIIVQTKENVLRVPLSAIQSQGEVTFVRLLKNGNPMQVNVTVGLSSDTETEIISGLSEGDEVITGTLSTGSQPSRSVFSGGFGGAVLRPGGVGGGRRD